VEGDAHHAAPGVEEIDLRTLQHQFVPRAVLHAHYGLGAAHPLAFDFFDRFQTDIAPGLLDRPAARNHRQHHRREQYAV